MPGLEFNTFSLSPLAVALCIVGLLFAYGLRGSTGFGGALGMAMLVVVIPIKVVVPAWTLLSITSSLAILGHDRRQIAWRDVLPFLPWCMLGIGIGLYLFTTLDARARLHRRWAWSCSSTRRARCGRASIPRRARACRSG